MSTPIPVEQQLKDFRGDFDALRREIGKVLVGQDDVVRQLLTAVVSGGHVLLEGVPGLGKTLLVETLGDVLRLTFQRIQFTPDLMPTDLLGTHVVMETSQGRRTFEFQKGPIFSHLILADQINRGLPKTQSALLEAMEGGSVSVSDETFQLPQPFFVVATQNPMEMEGTFPLPEPELDRFFLKLVFTSPNSRQIEEILDRTTEGEAPLVRAVIDSQRLLDMRELARKVPIDAEVRRWGISLVAATHPDNAEALQSVQRYVRYGASPRAAQALVLASKVQAIIEGRNEVTRADLRSVAHAVLRHRLILNFEGQAESVEPDSLVDDILQAIPDPMSIGPNASRTVMPAEQ